MCHSVGLRHFIMLCVSNFMRHSDEGPRMGVMIRCPKTFGHILYAYFIA